MFSGLDSGYGSRFTIERSWIILNICCLKRPTCYEKVGSDSTFNTNSMLMLV